MAIYNPQGTYNPQGSSPSLQGSSPRLQGSRNTLQVTTSPQGATFGAPAPSPQVQGASTTKVTGATYDYAAAKAAQEAAAKQAQANALKSSINGIINNVRGAYDAIYGDLNVVGADKANAVTQKYNNENTALIDQYNTDFPQIGNAYSSRGAYDSSYREVAEGNANNQYKNMQNQLITGRDEDLAKVGQFIDTQRAQVAADKNTLNSMAALIAQSNDPEQLQSYQQQIADRLNQVNASRAGLRSQAAYRASADQLVSTQDRSAGLKQTLSNILQGAAPTALKRSVAGKLIQSSGLPADAQAALVNDFEKQLLNGTDEQVVQQG